nr:PDR ABC-type transporter family protein [Tanacetum cinerariifolium]
VASEGQVNDISNNSTINDDPNKTSTKYAIDILDNPSNEREQGQVANGSLDISSECLREITKIFKERIDDAWNTWTKVFQPTSEEDGHNSPMENLS